MVRDGNMTGVTGVTADSRAVTPGDWFVAIDGSRAKGIDYVPQALQLQAGGLIVNRMDMQSLLDTVPESVNIYSHPQPRKALAWLARALHPGQPEDVVAVTGTNGKTSVAHFCREIWLNAGCNAASLGTLGLVTKDGNRGNIGYTSPDPTRFFPMLERCQEEGVTHLALEASSHGLDQFRMDGVKLKAAGFTNLTHDHLDYHGDMEHYFDAKARLFSELLPEGAVAVLNADDPCFARLAAICHARNLAVWDYGAQAAMLNVAIRRSDPTGQDIRLHWEGESFALHLPLIGAFQLQNVACALLLCVAAGLEKEQAVKALEALVSVPGRLELAARTEEGAPVFVDYAHTPDALERALDALRGAMQGTGELHVVFGCGGDRDREKRPRMGEIAAKMANYVVITDDNPRHEEPGNIRKEIMAGCPGAVEIGDRAKAIRQAVSCLKAGDVLLVAGKGHEKEQIVGDERHPFDDVQIAREAVGK